MSLITDRETILDQYIKEKKWEKAAILLLELLAEEPKSHWLLIRLGRVYWEQKDDEKALGYVKQALAIAPRCPLVLWDYAGTLYSMDRYEEAIKIYKKLIQRGLNSIAYDSCVEGIRLRRAFVNDCRYMMGASYTCLSKYHLAKKYLREHIAHRDRNCRSIYNLREVRKELAAVESGKNPWDI